MTFLDILPLFKTGFHQQHTRVSRDAVQHGWPHCGSPSAYLQSSCHGEAPDDAPYHLVFLRGRCELVRSRRDPMTGSVTISKRLRSSGAPPTSKLSRPPDQQGPWVAPTQTPAI